MSEIDSHIPIEISSTLKWFSKGFGVVHLKRPHRIGFKAGALFYGLHRAKGEFIAIFDADFIPDPNFLLDVVPHFANPKVACDGKMS